jgi:formylglycine-generating enzyme required for sulfatase activity
MEWLWAAMGADSKNPGKINKGGYYLAFAGIDNGGSRDQYVWYSINKTHETKKLKPNSLGLYDMSGNVGEWCWDLDEGAFPQINTWNYHGPNTGSLRVIKGANFGSGDFMLRLDYRKNNKNPGYKNSEVGLRITYRS